MNIKIFLVLAMFFSLGLFSQNPPPVLSKFRIENNQTSRVYFDSSENIFGSSIKGFVISGKTIIKLNIVKGQITGHYLEVSQPFSFWDNNTLRYTGGSDIEDEDNNALQEFTLSYIQNNVTIDEGSVKEIFVNSSVSKSGDGEK